LDSSFSERGRMPRCCVNQQSHKRLAVGLSIALWLLSSGPVSAWAQVPVVGYLWLGSPETDGGPYFLRHLEQLGQQEGRTFVVESRYGRGDNSKFPALARQLLDRRPAVIVTTCGVQLRAIRELSSTVPVIAGCADPKNFLGEVASLNRPGGRTTGFLFLAPESAAKRLQLLKELLPSLSAVGVLHNRQDDWSTYLGEMERAALQLGLTLTNLTIERADELDDAFATAVRERVQALVIFPDAIAAGARTRIAALAIKHKIPTVFDLRAFVVDGGLLSYGPNWSDSEFAPRIVATYVDKILRGAAPGDLPIQQPTRLELVINLKTARALGLNVPPSFLTRADEVIE
jgi:putative tryptophan/tyrosine transport system substrate-binding protein